MPWQPRLSSGYARRTNPRPQVCQVPPLLRERAFICFSRDPSRETWGDFVCSDPFSRAPCGHRSRPAPPQAAPRPVHCPVICGGKCTGKPGCPPPAPPGLRARLAAATRARGGQQGGNRGSRALQTPVVVRRPAPAGRAAAALADPIRRPGEPACGPPALALPADAAPVRRKGGCGLGGVLRQGRGGGPIQSAGGHRGRRGKASPHVHRRQPVGHP
jgi:hypothetical protein